MSWLVLGFHVVDVDLARHLSEVIRSGQRLLIFPPGRCIALAYPKDSTLHQVGLATKDCYSPDSDLDNVDLGRSIAPGKLLL
ncbi:hypothetical protein JAAARDRAFT_33234 [Jaapia argillacea MUCL 33604]|uniref:Uncharacterized protein n=1 Tax=Jaapia argillacea MUCL 33604 TaxID=933084 RepID=A0A067PY78_9AGAM|nr:hypothetical protein JAAARDRAFT_33234 [Jaapia argillacea MUCL 33604]